MNMNYRDENIVNIAMMAAEMLKDGRIERDEMTGHAGLTEAIVALADKFEERYAGVDWNSDEQDYWVEIDAFAEKELLERYGVEKDNKEQGLNIKVIISDGIVEGVLKDSDAPVQVEVVDVDRNYENYEALEEYREELYKDRSLVPCDYVVASLEEEMEPLGVELPKDSVVVYAVSGQVKHELFSGNYDQCKAFCEECNWSFMDENEFVWDLEMEDSREDLFPEGYFDAVDYFNKKHGQDLECECWRLNADKLVFCAKRGLSLEQMDEWLQLEEICDEVLSFNEYKAARRALLKSPYDFWEESHEAKAFIKCCLSEFRASQPLMDESAELEQKIQAAQALGAGAGGASGAPVKTERDARQ